MNEVKIQNFLPVHSHLYKRVYDQVDRQLQRRHTAGINITEIGS